MARICRALDGLPLALELAAPLIKLFSPTELRHWLSERLDLLGRQLFVAMTRARDALWAGWVGEPATLLQQALDGPTVTREACL